MDGFEFIEFSAPDKGLLEDIFAAMGFCRVAQHRSKDAQLWRQGGINFIANYEPASNAWRFAREHGAGACGIGLRVANAGTALAHVAQQGAELVPSKPGPMELHIPGIRGIGGSVLYLIDRYAGRSGDSYSIYDIDFVYDHAADRQPKGCGLTTIDHVTHNVHRGRLAHWQNFYHDMFGFTEFRSFAISGEYTGLTSKALIAPDGRTRIPLNEEGDSGGGQIDEFLRAFNGEGIQHIALGCDDICACWDRLNALGVPFLAPPPATYYEMLEGRLPGHGEDADALRKRGVLLDGSTSGGEASLLLQIFTEPRIGPLFFEFIERKGDQGFGEGNFRALFESMERDQIRRGTLTPV